MTDILKGLIDTMHDMGADSSRTSMDIEIDGRKYWVHLDIHEVKQNEEGEEK